MTDYKQKLIDLATEGGYLEIAEKLKSMDESKFNETMTSDSFYKLMKSNGIGNNLFEPQLFNPEAPSYSFQKLFPMGLNQSDTDYLIYQIIKHICTGNVYNGKELLNQLFSNRHINETPEITDLINTMEDQDTKSYLLELFGEQEK